MFSKISSFFKKIHYYKGSYQNFCQKLCLTTEKLREETFGVFETFFYKRYSSTELPQKNLPVYTKITYFTGQLVSSSSIFPNESNDMLIESFLWKSEISSE